MNYKAVKYNNREEALSAFRKMAERKRAWIRQTEQRDKLTYIIYCISAFGEKYNLLPKQAFSYLKRYGGLSFVDDCYAAEHMLSIDDAVNDMSVVCRRNGGGLE